MTFEEVLKKNEFKSYNSLLPPHSAAMTIDGLFVNLIIFKDVEFSKNGWRIKTSSGYLYFKNPKHMDDYLTILNIMDL